MSPSSTRAFYNKKRSFLWLLKYLHLAKGTWRISFDFHLNILVCGDLGFFLVVILEGLLYMTSVERSNYICCHGDCQKQEQGRFWQQIIQRTLKKIIMLGISYDVGSTVQWTCLTIQIFLGCLYWCGDKQKNLS